MKLAPDTAFARAALAFALALIGSQLLILLPLRGLMFGPASRQLAILFADNVESIQERLAQAAPEQRQPLRQRLAQRHGLHLDLTPEGPSGGAPRLYYQQMFGEALRERLGPGTDYRVQMEQSGTLLWVRASTSIGSEGGESGGGSGAWFGLSMRALEGGVKRILLIWGTVAVAVAIGTGFLLARSLTVRLHQLAALAVRIGQGELPTDFPRKGPREVRALSDALDRMAGDIRRNAEERALLLAGISHDLRTPLARMRLSVEMLDAASAADSRDCLVEEIDEMDAIIGAFIASVREGHEEPLALCDLNRLLRQAAARLARTGSVPALDLEPLGLYPLRPQSMARVLDNLLENARRHGAPPVTLRSRHLGTHLRLSVLDRGAGIAPDELPNLFRPFVRGRDARPGGTGLGLATARRIVHLHGGELSLHPRSGGGSEARIELPISRFASDRP